MKVPLFQLGSLFALCLLITTDVSAEEVDCSRCDYTHGQLWLPDPDNCGMYYLCEPLGNGQFRRHHLTCGVLFWSQAIHTCVFSKPADAECEEGPVSLYIQPTTPVAECPYEPYPGDSSKFWISGDENTVMKCVEGMQFFNNDDLCDCLPVTQLNQTCTDDLLLHFSYEDHYNDVTCHQAIATQYGDGVYLSFESARGGNVACFTGDTHFEVSFLRTWFADHRVDQFTVAVWFKRQVEDQSRQGIVNNGDCIDTAGFAIGHSSGSVATEISTDIKNDQLSSEKVSSGKWHHVAWVYDGNSLKVYVDKKLSKSIPMTGYLQNNDVPMYIANCCGDNFFVGCLDELRLYTRALSLNDIRDLP